MPPSSPVQSILPAPGVEFLRCHTCKSGFRNVYEHGTDSHGNVRYVAKVKVGDRLITLPGGRSRLAHVSAGVVVRWYLERFGDRWRAALRKRKCNPCKAWFSESRQGWLAAVWLWGNREEVRQVTKGGSVSPEAGLLVFGSRVDALAGCLAYASQRSGKESGICWRCGERRRRI